MSAPWQYMPEVGEVVKITYPRGSSYARVVQRDLEPTHGYARGFRCIEETGTVRRFPADTWENFVEASPCQGVQQPNALPAPARAASVLELAAADFYADSSAVGRVGVSIVDATVQRWRAKGGRA